MKGETSIYIISGIICVAIIGGIFWWASANYSSSISPSATATSSQTAASSDALNILSTSIGTTTASISTTTDKNFMHKITIQTNKGTIVFETYDADAPNTVKNFITLANKGFYNSLIFHRVIEGFMIQGGDPTGTGTGGPGYQFADELNPSTPSYQAGYVPGVVAMANSGPDTNGSQFFIMLADYPLPNSYTIFGEVTKGQEVVDEIGNVPTGANDRPVTPIKILGIITN